MTHTLTNNVLSKQQIAAIKAVLPRRSGLLILQNILVRDGYLHVTNLDCELTIKTDLADGLYAPCILDGIDIKAPFDAADFPIATQEADIQWQVTMPVGELYAALEFVSPSISIEATRYYLCGVCFHEDSIIATHGHTLHKIKTAHKFSDKLDSILPTVSVNAFLKSAKGLKGDVTIAKTKSRFVIIFADTVIHCKAIDGTFPDYKQVIPDIKEMQSFKFDAANYAALAKTFSKHPNKHIYGAVFNGNKAIFSTNDNPIELPCADSYPIITAYNYKYLASSGIKGTAYISSESDPMRVDGEDGDKLFIIMPVRI